METKYIFVTGGVLSGIGKGITVASLGRLLKSRGLKVASQKLDPYMNVDPGRMDPCQHGEVFVTDDGAETDLDLGHYERFMDVSLTKFSNITAGRVYFNILTKERNGGYGGQTVQVIPHVTDEIKNFIYQGAQSTGADILITEIGGTAGDIESQPFFEAIRQIWLDRGDDNCLFIHVSLIPYLKVSGEHKSKPTQHSVKDLQSMGVSPDIIIARADEPLSEDILKKLSLFCNVQRDCVIPNHTLNCLYEIPLMLNKCGLDKIVCRELKIKTKNCDLTEWENMVNKVKTLKDSVNIALVGKYTALHDAYLSIIEALNHAGVENDVKINIKWVDAADLTEKNLDETLGGIGGILVPGGFGEKGIEGKILAAKYARQNNIPYLGISLGLQTAAIDFARNVCSIKDANSSEFDYKTKNPVVDLIDSQKFTVNKDMRIGAHSIVLEKDTLSFKLYKQNEISERHRHRFKLNKAYQEILIKNGLKIAATAKDDEVIEIIENPGCKFFVGVQFHPEFKSRPNRAHPLFSGFIKALKDV
ncbi:MAG: CTP synthase [Firmicutes bacterium]|nr:CTP synthase [Bacillota bacterium]